MSEFINSIGEVLTNAFNNLRSSKDLLDNDTEDDDAVNSNNSAVNNVDQSIVGLYRQTIIEIARHICKSLPEVSQKGELKAPVPSSVDNEYKVLFKQLQWQQPKSPYVNVNMEMILSLCSPKLQATWTTEQVQHLQRLASVLNTQFVIYYPELLYFHQLAKSSSYKLEDGKVRMVCPYCSDNTYVLNQGWGYLTTKTLRKVLTIKGVSYALTRKYICYNPECSEVIKYLDGECNGTNGKRMTRRKYFTDSGAKLTNPKSLTNFMKLKGKGKSFTSSNTLIWDSLDKVQRINFGIIPLPGDWDIGSSLAKMWMDSPTSNFQLFVKQIIAFERNNIIKGKMFYSQFILENKARVKTGNASILAYVGSSNSQKRGAAFLEYENAYIQIRLTNVVPSSTTTIRKIFMNVYNIIEPHLNYNMQKVVATKTIKLDFTFRVASRMMFTIASRAPQVQLAGALGVFMNAHGEVLTWSFAESENHREIIGLAINLKKRQEKLHINKPLYLYNDTCCEGQSPKDHYLFKVFPHLEKVIKDPFHAVDTLITVGVHHPRNATFVRNVSNALLVYDENQDKQILSMIEKVDKVNHATALKSIGNRKFNAYRWRKSGTAEEQASRFMAVVTKELQLSEKIWQQNKRIDDFGLNEKKELALFRRAKDGSNDGIGSTMNSVYNLLKHIKKGCVEDPCPVRGMYREHPCGNDGKCKGHKYGKQYVTERGTSQLENSNKESNEVVYKIKRAGADLLHAKVHLSMAQRNMKINHEEIDESWFFSAVDPLPGKPFTQEKFGLPFFLEKMHTKTIDGIMNACEAAREERCNEEYCNSSSSSSSSSNDSDSDDDEKGNQIKNNSSKKGDNNNKINNRAKKFKKGIGYSRIHDSDKANVLKCMSEATAKGEKDVYERASVIFNTDKMRLGKFNELISGKILKSYVGMLASKAASEDTLVYPKKRQLLKIVKKESKSEPSINAQRKMKRKIVHAVREHQGKKQCYCQAPYGGDRNLMWYDLPKLSQPRIWYLLQKINVQGRSSLSLEDGRKVIEDRWTNITTHYKNLQNVDAVV